MAKNKLSIGCGDWMLKWSGMIGRLILNPLTNTFTWKGHWQGRHEQQACNGTVIEFTINDGKINIIKDNGRGRLPVDSEVLRAVDTLLKIQLEK